MVEIEMEETESNLVNHPKPSASTKTTTTDSSGAASTSNAGKEISDGFETASDGDLGDSGDDEKPEERIATFSEEEIKEKALAEANNAKLVGNKLFGEGKYEEALLEYDRALQLAPDMPSAVELRSMCHANRGVCFFKLVIYVLVRMLFFHSSFTWKHWIGLIVTSAAYFIPYNQLDKMAKPSYGDDGELLDGGFDMSTGGICGYMHDVIYITSFVQIMSILSGKFWYTYLVIPAFGAYKSSGLIKGLLSQGSEDAPEDEKSRKKREKMERKASRGKIMKTRSR